jgi:uncharacterized protein YbjT (DUF2867 family)
MTVLVTGATGKTGHRVAELLRARGVPARLGSRSGTPRFDWEFASTWGPALEGAERVYLAYYPDLAIPGATEAVQEFCELAIDWGVRRLVLLSGRGEEEAQLAEQLVIDSGLAWTIVRCSWFNQNFTEGFLLDPILAGEVALPVGDVPEPFVDLDDVADVAVAALTDERHTGQLYELTGPRLLTFEEAVAEIAKAAERHIDYVRTTPDAYETYLADAEVPVDFAWLVKYLFTEVLDGRNAHLADGVQRALGREPKDFADFARESAAHGLWMA